MKMRKLTAFVIAVVAVVATLGFVPVKTVGAQSADATFVQAFHEYSNEYITSSFNVTFDKDSNDKEYAYYFAYKHIDNAEYAKGEDGKIVKYNAKEGKTTFNGKLGLYDIKFFRLDGEAEADVEEFVFELVGKDNVANKNESIRYADDATIDYAKYIENVTKKLENKTLSDYYYYPELKDMLVSEYYDYNALTKDLYYAKPNSTSFTKTSSSSFQLSEVGTYSFYVLAKDPSANEFKINTEEKNDAGEKLYTLKPFEADGVKLQAWYKLSNEGHIEGVEAEYNTFVAPVFSFYFDSTKEPEITISSSEQGYIGLTYKDVKNSITIVAENEQVEYTLYFSESDVANPTVDTIENSESIKNVTDDEEVDFNSSSLYFTPNKKGYYYVVCHVASGYGNASAVTNAIAVNDTFREVKYESEFLKYNWLSVVFLSIAVISLIAIVIILIVPSKNKKETSKDNSITRK